MDYQQALGGLAAGMAGQGEMGMDGGGGDMLPCPMCQGAGMIPSAMLAGEGMPAVPPRLAARGGGMSPDQMMAGGPMPGSPRMSMGA